MIRVIPFSGRLTNPLEGRIHIIPTFAKVTTVYFLLTAAPVEASNSASFNASDEPGLSFKNSL